MLMSYNEQLQILKAIYDENFTYDDDDKILRLSCYFKEKLNGASDRSNAFLVAQIQIEIFKDNQNPPIIKFPKQTGWSDNEKIEMIHEILDEIRENNEGCLYRAFEAVHEHIMKYNDNSCSICMFSFENDDVFQTECGHFFHAHCFSRYWHTRSDELYTERSALPQHLSLTFSMEITCPNCRTPVKPSTEESQLLLAGKPPTYVLDENIIGNSEYIDSLKMWNEHRKAVESHYQRQREENGHTDQITCDIAIPIDETTMVEIEAGEGVHYQASTSATPFDTARRSHRQNRRYNNYRSARQRHDHQLYQGEIRRGSSSRGDRDGH